MTLWIIPHQFLIPSIFTQKRKITVDFKKPNSYHQIRANLVLCHYVLFCLNPDVLLRTDLFQRIGVIDFETTCMSEIIRYNKWHSTCETLSFNGRCNGMHTPRLKRVQHKKVAPVKRQNTSLPGYCSRTCL